MFISEPVEITTPVALSQPPVLDIDTPDITTVPQHSQKMSHHINSKPPKIQKLNVSFGTPRTSKSQANRSLTQRSLSIGSQGVLPEELEVR